MAVDGIQKVGSISPIGSTLNVGSERKHNDRPDIGEERRKFSDEQKKAAEDYEREQRRRKQEQERRQKQDVLDMLDDQFVESKKSSENKDYGFESFSKCLTIASRISKGDIVPAKDIQYLAEHEPDMYRQALLMRVPNPKPKKYKSIIDEDENSESSGDIRSAGSHGEASIKAALKAYENDPGMS